MKKIFLLVLIFISVKACSQRQPQSLGSPNTDVYSKGTIGSDSGHVFRVCRADTTAWNFGLVKNIPGVVVRTCDDKLWLRNNTAIKWVLIGTGAGSTDTSNIIIDSTYDDLAYSPSIDSLYIKSLRIQLNGVTIAPTSDNRKLSYDIIAGAGSVTDAGNGLTDSSGRIIEGGSYYKNTTKGTGIFDIVLQGASGATSTWNDGALAIANTANVITFNASTTSGVAGVFDVNPASTNTVVNNSYIRRATSGTAAAGIGVGLQFVNEVADGSLANSNQIKSKFTDVSGSQTSQFGIAGVTSGVTQDWFTLSGGGLLRLDQYGAGTLTTDGSGNVTATSDVRLKNVKGKYKSGLNAVMNINPIVYKWNDKSGFDTKHNYIGFSAQNIQSVLGPDAVGQDKEGYLSIQDRAIMAAMINAIKEQQKEIESLQKQINALKR